jgi:hypothetical protein
VLVQCWKHHARLRPASDSTLVLLEAVRLYELIAVPESLQVLAHRRPCQRCDDVWDMICDSLKALLENDQHNQHAIFRFRMTANRQLLKDLPTSTWDTVLLRSFSESHDQTSVEGLLLVLALVEQAVVLPQDVQRVLWERMDSLRPERHWNVSHASPSFRTKRWRDLCLRFYAPQRC